MSEYKLVVAADGSGPFGHFFVQLVTPLGTRTFGKYPAEDGKEVLVGTVPGSVRSDAHRISGDKIVSTEVTLSPKEAARVGKYIEWNDTIDPDYNLYTDNCITFVKGALVTAGKSGKLSDYFKEGELEKMGTLPYGAGDYALDKEIQEEAKRIRETAPEPVRKPETERLPPPEEIKDDHSDAGETDGSVGGTQDSADSAGTEEAETPVAGGSTSQEPPAHHPLPQGTVPPYQEPEKIPGPDTTAGPPPGPTEGQSQGQAQGQTQAPVSDGADSDTENTKKSGADAAAPASLVSKADAEAFTAAITAPPDRIEATLLKEPGAVTEPEMRALLKQPAYGTPGHPDFKHLNDAVQAWHEAHYADAPLKYDVTGRMVRPDYETAPPDREGALKDKDGNPFQTAQQKIGQRLTRIAAQKGLGDAVGALQTGLNLPPDRDDAPLKVDGVFGKKTKRATDRHLARFGEARVAERIGLGSFAKAVARSETPRDPFALDQTTDTTVGALFGDGARDTVARALQFSANQSVAENELRVPPLAEDGRIGPKTAANVAAAINADGPGGFTSRFGKNLGFL